MFLTNNVRPAVSAIVPAYNRRELACRAVRSLLDQDFAYPFEIVVVDDGSTDGTGEAVAALHRDVRVVRQSNQGAAVARHTGILAAVAEIVAFQDSDDVSLPNRLSILWEALQTHKDAALAFGLSKNREKSSPTTCWLPEVGAEGFVGQVVEVDNPLPVMIRRGTMIGGMNLMTYRALALKASQGRAFYRASNDYDLQLRLASYGPVVCVAKVLCEYEFHETGISRSLGEIRQYAFALCAADAAARDHSSNPAVAEAIRERAEQDWPRLAVGLAAHKDWKMLQRVAAIGLRHGRLLHAFRPLWWALDELADNEPEHLHPWLLGITHAARKMRARFAG